MRFASIRTLGFRNLAAAKIETSAQDVFLVGENGQGKSNFLEAVYFCSYASSFRNASDRDLISSGGTECAVAAQVEDSLYDSIQITVNREKKAIALNEKNVERKVLLSAVPSIVFCHEDMQFINGTPEERRRFFDQNLCLYDELYLDDLRRYHKIVKTRNALLRELKDGFSDDYSLLDTIEPQFISYGLELIRKREEEARLFSQTLKPLYEQVSGISNIEVEYRPSWKDQSLPALSDYLSSRRERELAFGVSLSGPHRDNYVFTRDGSDFSKKASTGQRRLLALLIRVAQALRYSVVRNCRPVLLLDDVLLELDGEKRVRFLSVLPEYDQAFYTFLPEEPYSRYKKDDTLVYKIKDGVFYPCSV